VSDNFIQPNAALEAQIAACQSSAEIAEVLRRHQEANGIPRQTDRYSPAPAALAMLPPVVDAPKEDGRLLRRAATLDDGRIQLVEAYSHYGLDILTAALLGKRL
jgi:hypothetical protein